MAGLLTGLVLAGSLLAQSSQGAAAGEPRRAPAAAGTYVVQPGDTLWELARGIVGPEGDPRPAVDRIREANGLEGQGLLAGARIVPPGS